MGALFGGGSPAGYGNLTPDQSSMLSQVGWYPRSDMVLPTGTQWAQPTGYSGLTPAQIAKVNQLGYYTPGDDPKPGGDFLDKLGKVGGLLGGKDPLSMLTSQTDQANQAASATAASMRAQNQAGAGSMIDHLRQLLGGHDISDLLYDPSLALQVLFRGTPPVTGMSSIATQPGQRIGTR